MIDCEIVKLKSTKLSYVCSLTIEFQGLSFYLLIGSLKKITFFFVWMIEVKKKTLVRRNDVRNIAIVAHVDHGKTTLVDSMLRQAKARSKVSVGARALQRL